MARYYFDLREADDSLLTDEEGMELASIDCVRREAMRVIAELSEDAARQAHQDGRPNHLAIEVRDGHGPVMRLQFRFSLTATMFR
jgi:hypothetical protein